METSISKAFLETMDRSKILMNHRDMPAHLASYIREFIVNEKHIELLEPATAIESTYGGSYLGFLKNCYDSLKEINNDYERRHVELSSELTKLRNLSSSLMNEFGNIIEMLGPIDGSDTEAMANAVEEVAKIAEDAFQDCQNTITHE